MENLVLNSSVSRVFAILAALPLTACIDDAAPDKTDVELGQTESELFTVGVADRSARFMVKNGSLCMAAPLNGNGPVVQLPCASEPRFWWIAEPDKKADPNGTNRLFKIHNQGRCLDVPDFGGNSLTANGAALQAFSCAQPMDNATQLNQQFVFTKIATGEYQIKPRLSLNVGPTGLCLDIRTGTTAPGNVLQQFTCKTSGPPDVDNQRFLLRPRLKKETIPCSGGGLMRVTTTFNGDTVPRGVIMNFPVSLWDPIDMTCNGPTIRRLCPGFTAQLDRANPSSASDVFYTCWE